MGAASVDEAAGAASQLGMRPAPLESKTTYAKVGGRDEWWSTGLGLVIYRAKNALSRLRLHL